MLLMWLENPLYNWQKIINLSKWSTFYKYSLEQKQTDRQTDRHTRMCNYHYTHTHVHTTTSLHGHSTGKPTLAGTHRIKIGRILFEQYYTVHMPFLPLEDNKIRYLQNIYDVYNKQTLGISYLFLAQWLERWTSDQQVMGSNPTQGKSSVKTLGKLFTLMCLDVTTQYNLVSAKGR